MRFMEQIWNILGARYRQCGSLMAILGFVALLTLAPACGDADSITQIDPTQTATSALSEPVSLVEDPDSFDAEALDPEEIDALDAELFPSTTLQGNIQRLPLFNRLEGFWNVNGVSIRVNSRTDIQVDFPLVGTPVTITGRQITGNLVIATLIEDTAFAQVDRMGIPALLTVFIPPNPFEPSPPAPALEDAFNLGVPANDQANFRGEIVNTLEILFSLNDEAGDDPSDDAAQIQGLADVLLPDVLTVQLSQLTGFGSLNGRNLEDDVIDIELGLITEGACTSDLVDNNSVFLDVFPFFGIPN